MFFSDYVRNMLHYPKLFGTKNIRMRKIISILFYQIGHNSDRLLWFNSPMNEWIENKLADLYQWAMWRSVQYDDYYEIWQSNNQISR